MSLRKSAYSNILIIKTFFSNRKHGHNELDDPTFTNSVLYKKIKNRTQSIPISYAVNDCKISDDEIKKIKTIYKDHLNEQLNKVNDYKVENNLLQDEWSNCKFLKKGEIEEWNTGKTIKQFFQTFNFITKSL